MDSVWREWIFENDTFVGMHYVMGQECSIGDREVKVQTHTHKHTHTHTHTHNETNMQLYVVSISICCYVLTGVIQL